MTTRIEIDCGEGRDAYQVILTGEGLNSYKGGSNKKGEALVDAILATPGVLTTANFFDVRREKNGVLNSGPNGEYSHQVFNIAGIQIRAEHHRNGQLNDNALTGEAAVQQFNGISRALREESRYRNGKRSDGTKNGQYGHVRYSNIGTLLIVTHYRNGKMVKNLSMWEIRKLNQGRTFRQRLARIFSPEARKAQAAETARVAAALRANSGATMAATALAEEGADPVTVATVGHRRSSGAGLK